MAYYWIPFLFVIFNCFVNNKKVNQFITASCFIYILLLCTFRDQSVGTDTFRYVLMAEGVRLYSSDAEYLYNVILSFIKAVKGNYTLFFFIMSALTWIPFYIILKKNSGNYFKYVLLLLIISNNIYFLDSLNAIRQMASTAMIIGAFYYYKEKKWKVAILFYALAIGLHSTAIVFLPFIYLSRFSLKPKTMVNIIIIAVIYSFLFSFVVDSSAFSGLLRQFNFFGISDYANYFEKERYMEGFNSKGLLKLIVFPAILCVISIYNTNNQFTKIYFIGIVLLCILSPVTGIAVRGCMGLTAAELLVLPEAMRRANKDQRALIITYLVVFSLYFAYSLITIYSKPEELGPYVSVFQK